MREIIIILCSTLLTGVSIAQDVTFRTYSEAKQVVVGSTFDVTFSMENGDGKNFKPPNFGSFRRVAGPSQSYQSSFVNGKSTKSISYSYTLQALKVGTFKIKGAAMTVGGRTLVSNTIEVQVVKKAANLTRDAVGPKIYLRAELDTNYLYVGQQVVLRYKIYTQVNIENYNIISESGYDGCFTQILDAYKERALKEVIDGEEFTTKVLRKVAIFPQQNGKIAIEPLAVRIGIPDGRKRRRSFFSSFNLKTQNISSNGIDLFVRSPHTNAPESFSGAVGSFDVKFSIQPLTVTTDDAITIRLRIVGNGDTKMIRPPELNLPSSFETYDPKVIDEKMINATDSVRGVKIFEYLALGKEPGRHVFHPVFTYFDPQLGIYNSIQDSFMIEVNPGKSIGRADNRLRSADEEHLARPMLSTELRSRGRPIIHTVWYWSAFGIPLLGFIWLAWKTTVLRNQAENKDVDHTVIAHARLAAAKQHLDDQNPRSFFAELALCLKNYLVSKTDLPVADLSKQAIRNSLEQVSVSQTAIDQLMSVLNQCDYALYAGIHDPSKMTSTYEDAVQSVKFLEAELENELTDDV